MREKFIPTVTMLTAGAIVSITCIVKDVDTLYSLELLLATLIIFYIIGLIGKKIIMNAIYVLPEQYAQDAEKANEENVESSEKQEERADNVSEV